MLRWMKIIYTPCKYFADEEGASMIDPDGITSTAWDYAGIVCYLQSSDVKASQDTG